MRELEKDLFPKRLQIFELLRDGRTEEANNYMLGITQPVQVKLVAALEEAVAFQQEVMARNAREAEAAYTTARTLVFGLTGVALALGVLAAWLLTVSITSRLSLTFNRMRCAISPLSRAVSALASCPEKSTMPRSSGRTGLR